MDDLLINERIDSLQVRGLKMIQAEEGYRVSLDPFLLADFALVRKGQKGVDLGTGSGILPLLIATSAEEVALVGVELQESLCERARRNVELNRVSGKIEVRQLDVREIVREGSLGLEGYDFVVMNPPYRIPLAGRISKDVERATCRHELNGNICDFLQAARWLVRQGGRVNVVFLAERLAELLSEMKNSGLEPKRLRMVHSDLERAAHLVLVEARKGGRSGLEVQAPLYIYKDGDYSEEIRRIFDSEPVLDIESL